MDREIMEKINPLDPRTEGEEYLLNKFKTSPRFKGWSIFEEPHINSMKPDFILLNPQKGIIIIEIKDLNLSSGAYESNAYINLGNGKKIRKNPIEQVENYKKMILKTELKNSVKLSEEEKNRYFGCIETVVYFHKAEKKEAINFCNPQNKYTKIWTKNDIDYIAEIKNKLIPSEHTFALSLNKSSLDLSELVKELKAILQYSDYNYERKQQIKLTSKQEELAKLKEGSIRRWSGVAGAGKSLCLAQKSVNALRRDRKVLILTFNITLRHYLRDLCSQQFGKGEREKLRLNQTIYHFHDFLRLIITEHEINIENKDKLDIEELTQNCIDIIELYIKKNKIKNHLMYDYILIDEGQDFRGEWIRFLKHFFTKKGELLVVYDKAQDLYNHGIWIEDSSQIKNIGFKGQPGNMKVSMRLPEKIVFLIEDIRNEFNIDMDKIKPNSYKQESFTEITRWINIVSDNNKEITKEKKLRQIESQVKDLKDTNVLEDITILTTNEETGAEIVKMFEAKGIKTSHVYDLDKQKDYEKRKKEKWKFQGGTGRLKICSYHSYKGWESPNIILVLDAPSTKYKDDTIYMSKYDEKNIFDAIFISMSRVKKKLQTGEFSFTCINYLPEYNKIKKIFD